jgi:hypothetical protein
VSRRGKNSPNDPPVSCSQKVTSCMLFQENRGLKRESDELENAV